ncbi:MAG: methyltransferase [Bacteroidota bacterium]
MKNEKEFPTYPPLFFVRITERLRRFFLRMNRRFTHPNMVLWDMVHNFWVAAGIGVVAELGIADLLRGGPRTVDELASETDTHPESLYRVMRMLATQGIFRELRGKRFQSTPLAEPLRDDQIRYILMLHLDPRHFQMFSKMMSSVKTGRNVTGEFEGGELFEHIGSDPKRNERFNRAMTNASWLQAPALLSAFSFNRYRKIIDIGGGQGLFLAAILRKNSACEGVVFDLPNALSRAGEVIGEFSLENRMETLGGDFFKEVPAGGDLYMMKSVLHDWSDEDSLKILANLHRAMKPGARLLVIESVIGKMNEPSFGKMTDILMMIAAGGRERTRHEWKALLERARFRIIKIHPTITPHSLIEAEKL